MADVVLGQDDLVETGEALRLVRAQPEHLVDESAGAGKEKEEAEPTKDKRRTGAGFHRVILPAGASQPSKRRRGRVVSAAYDAGHAKIKA